VIGGGNVALDAARMARRSGATVDIHYRRTEKEMPAMPEELHEAVQEGVNIHFLASPVACLGSGRTVERLRLTRMKLVEVDAIGRAVPVAIDGSDVDTVITAIGQKLDGWALEGLHLTPDGRLAADSETGATSMKGVFAGGDAVTGPGWAIDAIAAGKRAAASIHRYLS
jgi:NADPH-dependent glutamate synthase beta subunit-like oxidoreductase